MPLATVRLARLAGSTELPIVCTPTLQPTRTPPSLFTLLRAPHLSHRIRSPRHDDPVHKSTNPNQVIRAGRIGQIQSFRLG